MKKKNSFLYYFSVLSMFSMFLLLIISKSGITINTTKSIPIGIYGTSNQELFIGAYVIFCPKPNEIMKEAKKRNYITVGPCPGNYGYLMKKVSGIPNDIITINNNGVLINSKVLPNTKVLKRDSKNKKIPKYKETSYILNKKQLFLTSNITPTSFDSRYFGPVNKSQIISVIKPIYIF